MKPLCCKNINVEILKPAKYLLDKVPEFLTFGWGTAWIVESIYHSDGNKSMNKSLYYVVGE